MTQDQVLAICGKPHKQEEWSNGTVCWTYYHDCLEFGYSKPIFDKDGRLKFVASD